MNRYMIAATAAVMSCAPASAAVVYAYQSATTGEGGLQAGEYGRIPRLAPGAYEASIVFERAVERPQFEIGVVYGYTDYINGQVIGGSNGERPLSFNLTSPNRFDASFVINAAYVETDPFQGGVYTTSHHEDYLSARYFEGLGEEPVGYVFTISDQAAVPEPATWALMIVGFGLAGTVARRRSALSGHQLSQDI